MTNFSDFDKNDDFFGDPTATERDHFGLKTFPTKSSGDIEQATYRALIDDDDNDDDDESDFSDDEMYIDDYDDWNDCSVASHGVTGEQGMASHPNRQVKPENKIKKYLS